MPWAWAATYGFLIYEHIFHFLSGSIFLTSVGEFPGRSDVHYSDNQEYASNLMQYPEGQNFWEPSHTQQWNHGNHPSFPPHHGMNFPQPVPFAPMQGVPAPMVPSFYPHAVPPDARPSISIPEQVIASQIPEVGVQGKSVFFHIEIVCLLPSIN